MTSSEKYELSLRAYTDILNGYSVVHHEGKKAYLKHLRDSDYALLERQKEQYRQEAASKGLFSEEENLEMLNETGHWSSAEENKYQNALKEVQNLKKTESQIFLDSQRKIISQRVKEKEKELKKIGKYRTLVPLVSTEEFASNKINFFLMQFSFYKADDLKENLFTEKEFSDLHTEEVDYLTGLYFGALLNLSDTNIKRIACLGVFINTFMLAQGNPYFFFNKSVCSLTSYQTLLCNFGSGNKNILEHSENDMPSYDDVDDSIAWYDRERDIIKRKYSPNKSSPPSSSASGGKSPKSERFEGISVPNASKEEMETIGFEKQAQPMNLVEAAEKLKKKLGKDSLDIHDMVKLHS